jgi:hypothetical protein
MRWYPLTITEALLLLVVFLASGVFSRIQPYFVAPSLLPFTYVLFLFLLLLAYFPIVRPAEPLALAKFLAVILGAIYAVMILLIEVIARHNSSWAGAVVLAGAILAPLVAGGIYHLLLGPKRPR